MKVVDYSPPQTPTTEQQIDALQKGLGRASHWAKSGLLFDEPLLDACLYDKRYDAQIDASRGDWLFALMLAQSVLQKFRGAILERFRRLRDEADAIQLCELAACYAQQGDTYFRQELYSFVRERRFSESPFIGETQLIALDGAEAAVLLFQWHGAELSVRGWEWFDEALVELAVERLGLPIVDSFLSTTDDPDLRRFNAEYRGAQQGTVTQKAKRGSAREEHRLWLRRISAAEVVEKAADPNPGFSFRGWGMHNDEPALRDLQVAMWRIDDPGKLARILQVFSNRPLPTFDSKLIELCDHENEAVRGRAFSALAMNANPSVREFALEQLGDGNGRLAVRLFRRNFQLGDESRLIASLKLPDDLQNRHGLLMDVLHVLEGNEMAEAALLAVICYFETPCAGCRYRAAKLLRDREAAPSWLAEECRRDAEHDCRELFPLAGGEFPI